MSSPDLPSPVPPPHPFNAPDAFAPPHATDPSLADGASLPGGASLPAPGLWSDSDTMSGTPEKAGAAFAGLVIQPGDVARPTIGHIGRYALKYQLGTGGLGTVFAAHDPLLSRLIAVKTLNVEISAGERESFNQLFINEARAAGGLSHPHIVTVFDAGISDDRVYIAMELLKGRDLRQLMQEGWRATPAQAVLIVRRVADALAYAHSKGVIHRDIKPANIFMVGRTQPRVLDFGIARVTHRHETDVNAGAGSPYYMAPEQVQRGPTDRRADVFSLGVVLYELLTGRKPFSGHSLKAIQDQVLRHDPPRADKVEKAVPRDLAEIVERAMQKDPDRRFRSARSFARELRSWLDVHTVGAEGDGAETTRPSPERRRRWWIAGIAAGFVAVAMGASVATMVYLRDAAPAVATPGAAPVRSAAPPALAAPAAPAPVAAAASIAAAEPPVAVAAAPAVAIADLATSGATSVATAVASPVATPGATAATAPPPHPARETLRERRQREVREARERDAKLAAATPAPTATGATPTGKVRLAISPWGLVEVDGQSVGAAPPLDELTLPEGRHLIVVRNGDFPPFTMTVDVQGGQVMALRHKFAQ